MFDNVVGCQLDCDPLSKLCDTAKLFKVVMSWQSGPRPGRLPTPRRIVMAFALQKSSFASCGFTYGSCFSQIFRCEIFTTPGPSISKPISPFAWLNVGSLSTNTAMTCPFKI
jgi:hypothetical protein